ncbi:helix-turn-helix domain-containing protein [Nocardia terpenica]|uniref:helix-turn-helix domain-containing protein n=1 Tax=Nocardia terpenica TaxID=455432 RepID=UPI0039803D4D
MDGGSTLPRRQLGQYLRNARKALNISQETLAELADLSPSVVQRFEQGDTTRLKERDLRGVGAVVRDHRGDGGAAPARHREELVVRVPQPDGWELRCLRPAGDSLT